ncbi:hypothetical protein FISHEDRAFT_78525 [Fistulina hepatica ATCC 64428]|nr:hypothetical protein FISHEDRAFT_78525 [Fistulina hepatica ATCC 64428]
MPALRSRFAAQQSAGLANDGVASHEGHSAVANALPVLDPPDIDTKDASSRIMSSEGSSEVQAIPGTVEEEPTPEQLMQQQSIWTALREEHHEVIELLPLSLRRQYSLLHDLDEQAQRQFLIERSNAEYARDVLPTLRSYATLRQTGATTDKTNSGPTPDVNGVENENDATSFPDDISSQDPLKKSSEPEGEQTDTPKIMVESGDDADAHREASPDLSRTPRTPRKRKRAAPSSRIPTTLYSLRTPSLSTPRLSGPSTPRPPPATPSPPTAREMLTRLACLSEDLVRTSEEKLALAQAACDSIDRHISMLAQSIAAQEAALAVGIRPGTHPSEMAMSTRPVDIVLPQIVPPRWTRSRLRTATPSDGEENGAGGLHAEEPLGFTGTSQTPLGVDAESGAVRPTRGKRSRKKGGEEMEVVQPVVDAVPPQVPVASSTMGFGDPLATLVPLDDGKYCYCGRGSFGEMVGCDNKDCKLAWFHLGCIGLQQAPTDDVWYCRECAQSQSKSSKKSKRRRR